MFKIMERITSLIILILNFFQKLWEFFQRAEFFKVILFIENKMDNIAQIKDRFVDHIDIIICVLFG